ncbi:actinia tenebrosa protease inhibitors-like [Mercenaria mercenaria]|uniref:actinia tenebrosa protease inhibitors-like n=1 Tax=Mercenaria mercenaria TaxID=6596 RepID=UPI00234EDD32|nr:actinia tenebrosa protease inhibitors-like [Mercenaria mercenaria]
MEKMTLCTRFILFCLLLLIAGSPSEQQNVCEFQKETGPCLASEQRYYFDKDSGLCRRFTYSGCEGNGNNFETYEECRKVCGCIAPTKIGRCRALYHRYYFNQEKGECFKFAYGLCGANENNFRTKSECLETCA